MSSRDCAEIVSLLHDYLDDALPPARLQGIRAHLRDCADCSRTLEEIRATRRLLCRLPREPMPDPMKRSLLDELRRKHDPPN